MSLLFDISPQEQPNKRGARKPDRRAFETPAENQTEKNVFFYREMPPLGRIDHTYECADGQCGAQCHDILHEDSGEWRVECAFCGTGQWVKVIAGHLKPKEREFLLRDGRFAGLSLDEVEQQPRGLDYLAWALTGHPRQIVRDAVKKHMEGKA
jgi:hypothetical protein